MALTTANCLDVLTDDHDELVATQVSKKTTAASTPARTSKKKQALVAKKKQQNRKDALLSTQTKPTLPPNFGQFMRGETSVRRPRQKPIDYGARQNQPQHEEEDENVVERTLTLEEYEKKLSEKKKTINAPRKPDGERKANPDKDFESMKPLDKNKYNAIEKPNKDYRNRRNYEAKIHKSVDTTGLLSTLKIFVNS